MRPMHTVCVVSSLLVVASADTDGCVPDPGAPNACREGPSLVDSASLLQMKATERAHEEIGSAALTHTAAVTQRCSDSSGGDDCKFTDWTSWGGCSASCGPGIETRTRQTRNPEKCFEACLKEAQSCDTPCATTTPEPKEPEEDIKMCQIYGDPHFIAFDGDVSGGDTARLTDDGEGVLWAVKSTGVKIQVDCSEKTKGEGTGTGWGRCIGLAMSGDVIGDHVLAFTKEGKKTYFDGGEIELTDGSPYKTEFFDIEYKKILEPTHTEWVAEGYSQAGISDKIHGKEAWIWRTPTATIYFSLGDSLCAIIKMAKVGGMDGVCGNFDNIRANDLERVNSEGKNDRSVKEITTRMGNIRVPQDESLFNFQPPPPILLGQSLLQEDGRDPVKNCDPALLDQAKQKCAEIAEKTFKEACIYDICQSGEVSSEQDEYEEEVIEAVADSDKETMKEQTEMMNKKGKS